MAQAFKRIRLQGTAKAVILTGAGRAFCSGVDLTAAQTVFQVRRPSLQYNPPLSKAECPSAQEECGLEEMGIRRQVFGLPHKLLC